MATPYPDEGSRGNANRLLLCIVTGRSFDPKFVHQTYELDALSQSSLDPYQVHWRGRVSLVTDIQLVHWHGCQMHVDIINREVIVSWFHQTS